jgi:hypothetical protein
MRRVDGYHWILGLRHLIILLLPSCTSECTYAVMVLRAKSDSLKRTYAKARNEYKIKSYWTKFADLPSNIRRQSLSATVNLILMI